MRLCNLKGLGLRQLDSTIHYAYHPSPTIVATYAHGYALLTTPGSRNHSYHTHIDPSRYKPFWHRAPIVFSQLCYFGILC